MLGNFLLTELHITTGILAYRSGRRNHRKSSFKCLFEIFFPAASGNLPPWRNWLARLTVIWSYTWWPSGGSWVSLQPSNAIRSILITTSSSPRGGVKFFAPLQALFLTFFQPLTAVITFCSSRGMSFNTKKIIPSKLQAVLKDIIDAVRELWLDIEPDWPFVIPRTSSTYLRLSNQLRNCKGFIEVQ